MLAGLLGCLALLTVGQVHAATGALVINSNSTDPAPRAAWQSTVERFARENPDIKVECASSPHPASWKTCTAPTLDR